jgi:hypothetical protein
LVGKERNQHFHSGFGFIENEYWKMKRISDDGLFAKCREA